MAQATHAAFDAQHGIDAGALSDRKSAPASVASDDVKLTIHNDLPALESEWRALERVADCTAFQSFDWMACWFRNIGKARGIKPIIVTGRDESGLQFILPLAIETGGGVRRLVWFASDLCDYNAPLLATDFSKRFDQARFIEVWCDIVARLRSHPDYRYDLIHFEKMPEKVGVQPNPMLALPVALNPSHAYLTQLTGDWETFYTAKRSSATRRRDRTKRKRLAESGEVKFVNPNSAEEALGSLDILMRQKTRQFAAMGVVNLFAKPGYTDFYRDVAKARGFVHVSRLDVGPVPAAVNLGLTFRGCYYHVLASYDDGELSKFGPGAAHLHDLMGYAIEHGCTAFDFTIGDERYKRDWCDTEIKLYDHVALATARGAVVAGPLLAARAVKRWIKQTPAVWNAYTRVRALAAGLRGGNKKADAD